MTDTAATKPAGKIPSGKRVVVLGALSAIGEATARLYAAQGGRIVLAGRNADRLAQVASDLTARGAAQVRVWPADLTATTDAASELKFMAGALGGPLDAILVFYGVLGDHKTAETDLNEAHKIIATNYTSAAWWCLAAGALLEKQNAGVLVAVSSVAGDRGRQSNYVYGSAKAGLSILVEGIAHRLAPTKARAVVAKLGFVETPMTAHIKRGGPLWAKPEAVAAAIKSAAERGNKPVVYIPGFWRFVMLAVRNVPAPIFHKTKL
jgi:decaprenylphospho-beta-D-erythro-pentofuranosid-2-ulose 2-reductase